MAIALVPHVASDAQAIRVWLGAADYDNTPAILWRADDVAAAPSVIRPLAMVRSGQFADGNNPFGNGRVYSGVYEFPNVDPRKEHRIEATIGNERRLLATRTLPASVPFGPQDRFNILLVTCFHRLEDKTGLAGQILSQLKVQPDLCIYAGDQVYQDLPTLMKFQSNPAWLAAKFEDDYLHNWFGYRKEFTDSGSAPPGLAQVLNLAPGLFMPDDHEYWNNYPFPSPIVQTTWSQPGRDLWRDAANAAYKGFQLGDLFDAFGAPRIVEIEPLSLLMLDTRSQRPSESRENPGDLLGQRGGDALQHWVDTLVNSATTGAPRYGLLVTGQSLFRSEAGKLTGTIADYELADYTADYDFVLTQLERVSAAGLPVVCLTGDVHWGRTLRADDGGAVWAPIFEVISSPLSLVSTVFADQAKEVWNTITGLWGATNPWPRHSDPEDPPPRFGTQGRFATGVLQRIGGGNAAMRGNHAVMLRFARAGTGLDVRVEYYPLHADPQVNSAGQFTAYFELKLQPVARA